LDKFGVPHERIHQYSSALEAGQIAVSVHARTPDEVMRAREVLGAHNADEVDVYAVSTTPTTEGQEGVEPGL
jgi:hypothetical protein